METTTSGLSKKGAPRSKAPQQVDTRNEKIKSCHQFWSKKADEKVMVHKKGAQHSFYRKSWSKVDTVIVITFYSPGCLCQVTAKRPIGLPVNCHQPTCLSHTMEASHCPFNY